MKLHRLARALVLNWFVDASVTAMSIAAAHKFISDILVVETRRMKNKHPASMYLVFSPMKTMPLDKFCFPACSLL
jgi:hypothetical protein